MGDESFIEKLRSTRDDYDEERKRHRFLLDAYAGTGGFRGRVKAEPASYWGSAADVYTRIYPDVYGRTSDDSVDTYLDRFPREDEPKFRRRRNIAQYPNHVQTAVDVPLSFLSRQPMMREHPEGLGAWMDDVTGNDDSWESVVREVVQERAAVVGYCPVLFDLPPMPRDELGAYRSLSVAQALEQGLRLKAIPLFPAHMLDWDTTRDGRFSWAKLRICETERTPFGGKVEIERIAVWTPESASTWTIVHEGNDERLISEDPEEYPHDFGEVPIAVLRWKRLSGDPVRGLSMIESIAPMARRMFNYLSELDEHIRQSVFCFLQVPTKEPEKAGSLVTGNGNALPIHPDSKQSYEWLAPPATVSEVLEKRINETRQEIYRQARIEFTQATSGQARSGVSRAFEFETANRAIADYARRIARFEERALAIASKGVPGAGSEEEISVTPPAKFAVEEMLQVLEEVQLGLELGLGMTAEVKLKKRVVERLIPNLSDEDLATIEAELEEKAKMSADQAAQMAAASEAMLAAAGEDDDDEEAEDDSAEAA